MPGTWMRPFGFNAKASSGNLDPQNQNSVREEGEISSSQSTPYMESRCDSTSSTGLSAPSLQLPVPSASDIIPHSDKFLSKAVMMTTEQKERDTRTHFSTQANLTSSVYPSLIAVGNTTNPNTARFISRHERDPRSKFFGSPPATSTVAQLNNASNSLTYSAFSVEPSSRNVGCGPTWHPPERDRSTGVTYRRMSSDTTGYHSSNVVESEGETRGIVNSAGTRSSYSATSKRVESYNEAKIDGGANNKHTSLKWEKPIMRESSAPISIGHGLSTDGNREKSFSSSRPLARDFHGHKMNNIHGSSRGFDARDRDKEDSHSNSSRGPVASHSVHGDGGGSNFNSGSGQSPTTFFSPGVGGGTSSLNKFNKFDRRCPPGGWERDRKVPALFPALSTSPFSSHDNYSHGGKDRWSGVNQDSESSKVAYGQNFDKRDREPSRYQERSFSEQQLINGDTQMPWKSFTTKVSTSGGWNRERDGTHEDRVESKLPIQLKSSDSNRQISQNHMPVSVTSLSLNQNDSLSLATSLPIANTDGSQDKDRSLTHNNITETESTTSNNIVLLPSVSEVEVNEIENEKVSSPEKKMLNAPPMTCASLGNIDKSTKAESAVRRLSELTSLDRLHHDTIDGSLILPTTQHIMQGISGIESQIKDNEQKAEQLRLDREESLKQEENEKQLELQQRHEEQRRKENERLEHAQKNQKALEDELIKREQIREEYRKKVSTAQDNIQELQKKRDLNIDNLKETLDSSLRSKIQEKLFELLNMVEKIRLKHCDDSVFVLEKMIEKTRSQVESENFTIRELFKRFSDREVSSDQIESRQTHDDGVVDGNDGTQGSELSPRLISVSNMLQDEPELMRDIVSSVLTENRRRARESHLESLSAIVFIPDDLDSSLNTDEQCEKMKSEFPYAMWSYIIKGVTGPENALYTEPSDSPFFNDDAIDFIQNRHLVREHIRSRKRKLYHRWKQLAHEYFTRQQLYKTVSANTLSEKDGNNVTEAELVLGKKKETFNEIVLEQSSTRGNNLCRRPRRGVNLGSIVGSDVVRSEYEQEQIIAELTAQEAMERKIAYGGCKLPRQRCDIETRLFVSYRDTLSGRRVFDPVAEAEDLKYQNPWTDMEKCIFLDSFLQYPKDFRKIASFLKNKSVRDCIAFYYDSKQSVPYKAALKEHLLRRKRKGDAACWDATIQAAISVGAIVTLGSTTEKPVLFSLPLDDHTYYTRFFHPFRRDRIAEYALEDGVNASSVTEMIHKTNITPLGKLFLLDHLERLCLPQTDLLRKQPEDVNIGDDVVTDVN